VVFFMCLWSIDTDVVLVGMSCFALLCQEADIRCGSDEITTQCLLPNYAVFQEIAHTSTVLTTGNLGDLIISPLQSTAGHRPLHISPSRSIFGYSHPSPAVLRKSSLHLA
jgi:hypothetical protein